MTPSEVVRAYFESRESKWLAGELADWADFHARISAPRRYESEYTFRALEVLEETEATAVVVVQAGAVSRIPGGTQTWRTSFDGPVVLERTPDGWRIADYTVDGRRRSASLVLGPLAEQENGGVAVRALGVDRVPRGTEVLLEVWNGGAEEIRLDRAVVLHAGRWRRPTLRAAPVAAGESTVIALTSGSVALTLQSLTVGLRARARRRTLSFLLHVPLARPAEPFRSAPPRRLPLMASPAAPLAVTSFVTLALAVLIGWFALAVPIAGVLVSWRNRRVTGRLPARLQPFRHMLDVAVVGLCCAVPWFTPAADLTVPVAVGVLAFLLLRFARLDAGRRVILAGSVATGWLALLGGPDDALSPCRLSGGDPARTADAFAAALFRGERRAPGDQSYGRFLPHAIPPRAAARALAARRDFTSTRLCRMLAGGVVTRCYFYPLGTATLPLYVGVRCEAHDWRVVAAL